MMINNGHQVKEREAVPQQESGHINLLVGVSRRVQDKGQSLWHIEDIAWRREL